VLGLHGLQGRPAVGVGDVEQLRPQDVVLGRVVVVQDRAELGPPDAERAPDADVLYRGVPRGGSEPGQVPPEGVVGHVHAVEVQRPLGHMGLAGQVQQAPGGRAAAGGGAHRDGSSHC
jgi:hypothetical protein